MNKPTMIVGIIAIAALVLIMAYSMGYLDDALANVVPTDTLTPEGAETESYSNRDIYTALCVLTDKTLPWAETDAFIDSLHFEMYGVDDQDYGDIGLFYKTEWEADGYVVYTDGYDYHSGYTSYQGIWTSGMRGNGLVASSGSGITSVYGYDCVFIIGDGPLTTWYAFATMVASV